MKAKIAETKGISTNDPLVMHIQDLLRFSGAARKCLARQQTLAYKFNLKVKRLNQQSQNGASKQVVKQDNSVIRGVESRLTSMWGSFIRESLAFQHMFNSSLTTLEKAREALEERRALLSSDISSDKMEERNQCDDRDIRRAIAKFGGDGNWLGSVTPAKVTTESLEKANGAVRTGSSKMLRAPNDWSSKGDLMEEVNVLDEEALAIEGALIGSLITGAIALAKLIIDLVMADRTGDIVQNQVMMATCAELQGISSDDIDNILVQLLGGITSNSDEDAILKLLRCLGAEVVSEEVWPTWSYQILDKFQGDELDLLMTLLRNYGIISFSEMDAGASREFINSSSCEMFVSLDVDDIHQLVTNLFSGITGDRDEEAIIRLLNCLPCDTIRMLVSMPDTSVDDFDRQLQGRESRDADSLFENCGA